MEELLNEIARDTGSYALWILFAAAMVEYIFPPFPGDSVTLFGAYYAVAGTLALPLVFLSVTAGSVVGSAIDYLVGLRLGQLAARSTDRPLWYQRWISPAKVDAIATGWKKRGDWLILANRFLPGIRAFFFVVAGMTKMPFRRVMLLGALSAALWNALLLVVGYVVGANLDHLASFFRTYTFFAWILVGVGVGIFLLRWYLRQRRARRE